MNQGKLIIGENPNLENNKIYDVVRCYIKTSRHHNSHRPDSVARCEVLSVTLASSQVEDNFLFEWYINQTAFSARLEITLDVQANNAGESEVRIFKLTEAKCFSLQEEYDIHFKKRHLTKLEIYAKQMEPTEEQ